ncbi:MAG TPA: DUF885 family protein [Roseiflexaceae bacterium]|nr:DUF885 family protein [Roseiflexaceae bacterium]
MTNAPAFTAWLDDFFTSFYQRRPVSATFVGVHDYDERLPDFSQQGLGDMLADAESLLARLRALPVEPLSEAAGLDRRLAEGFLELQRWEMADGRFSWRNPSALTGEAAFGVISLLRRPFAPIGQRLEAAIARMEAIPGLLAQGRATLRDVPTAWAERALGECTGMLRLFGDGIARLAQEHHEYAAQLALAGEHATAAVREFERFLKDELRHDRDEGYACGAEALDLLLRRGHFLLQSADEIERYAEEQLSTSLAYLAGRAPDFGVVAWPKVLAQLADVHPSVEGYYARYAELWQACRALAEERRLLTWPEYPIRFVPRPAWARAAAPHLYFLFYHSPAPLDQLPEVEYLVTPIELDMPADEQERLLRANNESVIKLNHVVHHGALGHHVQNWYAFCAESRIGRVAGVDCASRIAMFCAGSMTEGWACYATELMDEAGLLTPLEAFAERHTRLRMAARALVDVRLHTGRISLDQAAAFYQERVGMAPAAAKSEAAKNSMFPGTALMYLVGTDTIRQLRDELSARPGFKLRAFHDRLLSYGSVPAALVAERMRETVFFEATKAHEDTPKEP